MNQYKELWLSNTALGQWLLSRALRIHETHPDRFRYGPARCSLSGWIYFRLLCGISRCDANGV